MKKYPNFDLWQEFLSPIEVAFVILWTMAKEENFTEIKYEGPLIFIEDKDVSGEFEWIIEVSNNDKKYKEMPIVTINYSWSGGYYGGQSASHHSAPEPSTYFINSLEVENLLVYHPEISEDVELKDNLVDKNTLGFTYQNMLDLAYVIGLENITHDELNDKYVEKAIARVVGKNATLSFPSKLEDKIKNIFKNNNKFITKKASRNYGL